MAKIWKRCYALDPTDGLEPVNNGWKMIGQNLEPDWYSRKCPPVQLVKDIDTYKAMVVENSDDEWTDESDDDIWFSLNYVSNYEMISMKVSKLHMCTSTYAYNYTRSSSSYW